MTREFSLHQVGDVIIENDRTHGDLGETFESYIAEIQAKFNVDFGSLSSTDKENTILSLKERMDDLRQLAMIGEVHNRYGDPSTTEDQKLFYLTKPMLEAIDDLSRTITIAGIDLNSIGSVTSEELEGFQRWQAFVDVKNILEEGVSAVATNRSIQAMIETNYIVDANQMIFDELSGLEERLEVTKQALADLSSIQNEKNRVEPENRAERINPDPVGSVADPLIVDDTRRAEDGTPTGQLSELYEQADAAFGEPIQIVEADIFDENGFALTDSYRRQTILDTLTDIKDSLNESIIFLAANRETAELESGSLEEKLIAVRNELPTNITDGDPKSVQYWLFDNNNTVDDIETAGDFQQHITEAIVAAENLNDQQKEELRRTFFLFEEFYKSATAVLSKVNQIIEKMATNVASR